MMDVLWAIIVSLLALRNNSDINTINTLSVWFVTLLFFWHASQVPVRFFSQSYRHPVRLIFSVVAVALVYFFVLRADYSIFALSFVSFFWLLGAFLLRYFFINIKPPERLLGHPDILAKLGSNARFTKVDCKSPKNLDLTDFDCVVFDPNYDYSKSWQDFFVHISTVGIPVFGLSELQELLYGKVPVELLKESWINHSFVVNRFYLKLKRFVDLIISIICLPFLLVVSLFVALLIKIFMGGDVLFRQQRVGLGGESFTIYKFRTMLDDDTHQETNGASDPRITKLGRYLRAFRLDELPQFINVIKGEMSLIGPRPEWLATANKFSEEIPLYQLRHIVRPGITGWAQVQQGHTVGTEGNYQKLRYDLYYIKHCSIWLDLKIILVTINTLLFGKGV